MSYNSNPMVVYMRDKVTLNDWCRNMLTVQLYTSLSSFGKTFVINQPSLRNTVSYFRLPDLLQEHLDAIRYEIWGSIIIEEFVNE